MNEARVDAEKALLKSLRAQSPQEFDDLMDKAERKGHKKQTLLNAFWSLMEQHAIVINEDMTIRLSTKNTFNPPLI